MSNTKIEETSATPTGKTRATILQEEIVKFITDATNNGYKVKYSILPYREDGPKYLLKHVSYNEHEHGLTMCVAPVKRWYAIVEPWTSIVAINNCSFRHEKGKLIIDEHNMNLIFYHSKPLFRGYF